MNNQCGIRENLYVKKLMLPAVKVLLQFSDIQCFFRASVARWVVAALVVCIYSVYTLYSSKTHCIKHFA